MTGGTGTMKHFLMLPKETNRGGCPLYLQNKMLNFN